MDRLCDTFLVHTFSLNKFGKDTNINNNLLTFLTNITIPAIPFFGRRNYQAQKSFQ